MGLLRVVCEKGLENRLWDVKVRHCDYTGIGSSWGHDGIPVMIPAQREEKKPRLVLLEKINPRKICCIFISASDTISHSLHHLAEHARIPLLTSTYDTFLLESRVRGLLKEKINHRVRVHGVLLKMFGRGVLIQGDSGAGKTTTGAMLVKRGHTWIADDVIGIKKKQGQRLYARGCNLTCNLIDLKESGIQEARKVFAGRRLERGTDLHLILKIKSRIEKFDRRVSANDRGIREIMETRIPCIRIPSFQDEDFDVLKIERRVKAFITDGGAL